MPREFFCISTNHEYMNSSGSISSEKKHTIDLVVCLIWYPSSCNRWKCCSYGFGSVSSDTLPSLKKIQYPSTATQIQNFYIDTLSCSLSDYIIRTGCFPLSQLLDLLGWLKSGYRTKWPVELQDNSIPRLALLLPWTCLIWGNYRQWMDSCRT